MTESAKTIRTACTLLAVAAMGALLVPADVGAQVIRPGKTPFSQDGPGETADVAAQAAVQPAGPPDRVSILVHLEAGADRGPMRQFAANQGGNVKYEYDILPNVVNLREMPVTALNGLLQTPGVVRWEEDMKAQAHMNDSAPLIRALQSQLSGAGFNVDGTGVRICILDTGIDSDSIMYSTRIDTAAGRDFVNNDNNPEDDNGHGSHVAGTALGGDNLTVDFGCVGPEPFQGVAPGATLVGVKVLDSGGSGSFSDIIAGINYGADQSASGGRCDVINMSLGGGQFSGNCDSDSGAAAANNAVDAGVVVVSSSGNDAFSNSMGTPACGSKVIAVGATYDDSYPNCEFPSQTSFQFCTCVFIQCCGSCTDNSPSVDQIGCYSNRSSALDVVAPGCITFSADSTASPNGLSGFCGTSQASPHVAGLAALLLDLDPSLTPAQIRQHIRDGAIDLGANGFDNIYGYGRIDAINSLSLVGPGCQTNGDCDDSDACTTDTCNAGSCSNTPISCDDGDACTADSCDFGTGCVNAPISCDDGDSCTIDSCDSGTGCANDPVSCPPGESCVGGVCQPQACNNDGTCDAGEDCNNCPNDCFSGSGASCDNGICEAGDGEDCVICPQDCNGTQSGRPSNRFCCGDGDGQSPLPCSDSACSTGGWACTDVPAPASCCGDGTCEGAEDGFNCEVDCGAPEVCGNGNCGAGEDFCNCTADCGSPPAENCTNGVNDDCDNDTDCADSECATHPDCQCGGAGAACSSNADCCSNKCKGNGTCR